MKRLSIEEGLVGVFEKAERKIVFWVMQDDLSDTKGPMEIVRILRSYRHGGRSFRTVGSFAHSSVNSEPEMPAFYIVVDGEDFNKREVERELIAPLRNFLGRRRAGTIVDFEVS